MKIRQSLKLRITLWYAAFMLVLTGILLLFVILIATKRTDDDVQNDLITTVTTVVSRIDGSRSTDFNALLDEKIENQQIGIYSSDGSLMAGTEPNNNSSLISFVDGNIQSMIINYQVYYIYDLKVDTGDSYVWVRGYVRALNTQDTMMALERGIMVALPVTVLVMLAGGWILTGRMLRPLNRMIAEADSISDGEDLERRVNVPSKKDEIQALGKTINGMLERLQKSFQREKQFSSDASHELRTPVSVILAQCEMAQEDVMTDAEYQHAFDVIERQAGRMKQLIEDLLQLGRMESGRVKTEFAVHNLTLMVRDLLEDQRFLHGSQDVYVTEIEDDIALKYDENLLFRAFMNLLNNAHQYGRGWIRVTLCQKEKEVIFTVEDHGRGIQQENIDRIWDRFYQEDTSRSAHVGFGLGLPMVKDIIQLHEGTIKVNSVPDAGTVFEIHLPCDSASNKQEK